jgi:hypothetical protein
MSHNKRFLGGMISLLLVACTGESDELPVRFETEHFRYHAEAGRWLCPGLGERLEHNHAIHTDWLGATTTGKIDYFLLPNLSAVQEKCGQPHGVTPGGCVIGSSIYSWHAYFPHELIHAYSQHLGDKPPLFFNEGLAVMLGGGPD